MTSCRSPHFMRSLGVAVALSPSPFGPRGSRRIQERQGASRSVACVEQGMQDGVLELRSFVVKKPYRQEKNGGGAHPFLATVSLTVAPTQIVFVEGGKP